jgi:hypothetical protein
MLITKGLALPSNARAAIQARTSPVADQLIGTVGEFAEAEHDQIKRPA